MNSTSAQSLEDIAIIGMSGRFPGARNLDEFWNNLRDGVESIQFFSEEELSEAGVSSSNRQNPDFVNAGGPLDDIEMFDAPFFAMTAREAETLDPQQRLLLECASQALEDAAYDPQSYKGSIGVYAGGILSNYLFNLLSNPEHRKLVGDFQVFTGNDKDHLTTRISYKLNLKGPSITVQTACSTSLVAVAMACQSLLNYQSDMVLAGGVAIRVPQRMGYVYQDGMIFSRDGHCRPFDAEASGTLFSNGVGMVVLKRLADAVADRDCIHAVIHAAAINNDGSLKVGYTAPSVDAQAEVIAMAHGMAGVSPETITYIEAHGTATPLGDPIEIAALAKAFRAGTQRKNFCAIGSVKSNLGHLDAAAGIAGLIKTVLALKHQQIPPSINFTRPNPAINFADSPFYVNTQLSKWSGDGGPRRAGVSSFGIGGTNAHVVLEEAPPPEPAPSDRSHHLLLLSARSKPALDRLTASYSTYLHQHTELALDDVAYTTQVGRKAFTHRRIVVTRNTADAASALARPDSGHVFSASKTPGEHPVAFLFPGQGAQQVNMGRDVYLSEPSFRRCVDNCCEILKPFLGFDLKTILYPNEAESEDCASRMGETEVAQPALFVIEYALSKLWMEWGIQPETMLGHSIGEYVAACLADVFSLEDALRIVAERGRLMQATPR
jgi:acyl transferase domain-containing protein